MLSIARVESMTVERRGCHTLLYSEMDYKKYVIPCWQLSAIMLLQYIAVVY